MASHSPDTLARWLPQSLTKDVPGAELERAKRAALGTVLSSLEGRAIVAEDIGRQLLTYGHRCGRRPSAIASPCCSGLACTRAWSGPAVQPTKRRSSRGIARCPGVCTQGRRKTCDCDIQSASAPCGCHQSGQ